MAARRASQWARARADLWGRIWFAVFGLGTVANFALLATFTPSSGTSQLAIFVAGELVVAWASMFALATRDALISDARVHDEIERLERLVNARTRDQDRARDLRVS
jgi:hypothetical protein